MSEVDAFRSVLLNVIGPLVVFVLLQTVKFVLITEEERVKASRYMLADLAAFNGLIELPLFLEPSNLLGERLYVLIIYGFFSLCLWVGAIGGSRAEVVAIRTITTITLASIFLVCFFSITLYGYSWFHPVNLALLLIGIFTFLIGLRKKLSQILGSVFK